MGKGDLSLMSSCEAEADDFACSLSLEVFQCSLLTLNVYAKSRLVLSHQERMEKAAPT